MPTVSFHFENAEIHLHQREWDTYDPITVPSSGVLACNTNGANLGANQLSATVAAGSKITAYWNQWPHTIGVGRHAAIISISPSQR